MPSLDSLPGDQRAVLQLVLGRGRTYDQIAQMLSIDVSAVRARALAAVDALGPATSVAPENLARISDYLLGQLPESEAAVVRDQLVDSPGDRAWARVIASELSPLAAGSLPEIPSERGSSTRGAPAAAPAGAQPTAAPDTEEAPSAPAGEKETARPVPAATGPAARAAAATGAPPPPSSTPGQEPQGDGGGRRSSRLGGMILIAVAVVIVIAVVVVLITSGGSSSPQKQASTPVTSSSTPAASSTTPSTSGSGSSTTTGSTTSGAKVLAQINLTPPSGSKAPKAAGIAEVLNEGKANGVAIVAQNMPANTANRNAYAVWLYNSPTDAKILGFVNPGVGKTGRLSTAGGLPTNASHYKQLIVTLETSGSPKKPGAIVLSGRLSGVS